MKAMMDHPEGLTSESSTRAFNDSLVSLICSVLVWVFVGSFMSKRSLLKCKC